MEINTEATDIEMLRKFVPFNELSENHLAGLINKSEVIHLPKGKVLFKRDQSCRQRYYLLEGEVSLCDAEFNNTKVFSETPESKNPIDNHTPHKVSAITTAPSSFVCVDNDYLDRALTWEQAGEYLVTDLIQLEAENAAQEPSPANDVDWMSNLLQAELFNQIPPSNIQRLFLDFQELVVEPGSNVIKEGEVGDRFYVISSGKAVVKRIGKSGHEEIITQLQEGDFFGEEALVAETTRNATVTMLSSGVLMYLDKAQFKSLLEAPIIQYLSVEQMSDLQDKYPSTKLLDVRLPLEFKNGHIDASVNMPLSKMRELIPQLSKEACYITTCEGGRRSELGAYLLSQAGFEAYVLSDQGN
ncbi:MAG: calcium-binding protein [Gammaproteobacteria bacterium]|nr:MAG: calcium-binding protein [Gammaproteobacteria bacterium]